MRRIWSIGASALAMGVTACGGGGSGAPDIPAPAPRLQMGAAVDDSGRAPSGVAHAHRIELRNTGNASARAVVVSVGPDAQALQLPLSCESASCVQRSDGGVDVAEIPAGGSVVLRQQLRIKPGYRGAVRNDWQVSATGANAVWRQELTAYVADLAVTVGEPSSASVYEVSLANQGPDEATGVSWDLLPVPGQSLRVAGCSAAGGAVCPSTLGEAMTLARLPAGGSLRLKVEAGQTASGPGGVASSVEAPGDPDPSNDVASNGQPGMQHLFMSDLEGRPYRLSIGASSALRVTAKGLDYRADYSVDATGQGLLRASDGASPAWSRGTVSFWGPIMVLGLDIGGVRKPYLAPRSLVTQLSELEGASFNVLGSRSDATGKPTDAYVGSARFKDGAFQLCLPDTQTPFDQCPATRLARFEAAVVGGEIELVGRDKVMRLRAARSPEGPVLLSSVRDAATGSSEFWIGLPGGSHYPFGGSAQNVLHEATFESASGQSTTVLADLISDFYSGSPVMKATPRGVHSIVLDVANTGVLGVCGLTAQFSAGNQPGLFQAQLQADWLPGAYRDGQFVKDRPCFAGPVLHAQTMHFAAFLGARGGDLMGRWMFVGAQ